jgi:Type IV secretion system pilin
MKKILYLLILFILLSTPILGFAESIQDSIENNINTVENTAMSEDFIAKSPQDIIINVIKIVLSFLAVIFVILIIISGYQWMTAGGNTDAITKARQRILNAVIGLIIILAAFAVTEFVLDKIIMTVA